MSTATVAKPKAQQPARGGGRLSLPVLLLIIAGVLVLTSLVRIITGADGITSTGQMSTALRLAVPIGLAGLGGLWSERSGVVNIGLEGMMILGTWFGAWAGYQWGPWTGVVFGIVGVLAALGMRRPDKNVPHVAVDAQAHGLVQETRDYGPREMLRSPIFWLMFVMMTMMSTSGLMVISQMGAFAKDFGVKDALVFGLAALPLALTIDRFTNGLTRPFFGWVSDKIGRENTMLIAFGIEGIAMTIWLLFAHHPLTFVLLSGVVFFGWGEIFSLFPSTLTDTFGTKNATTNYGFLYIAQGVGSVLGGPLAAELHEITASWNVVFGVVIAMNFLTAFLAIAVLKPMRANHRKQNATNAALAARGSAA